MLKLASKRTYGSDMDDKCIDLCDALNSIRGITTFESCCGHGVRPYSISFVSDDLIGLFFITRCVDRRYWRFGNLWTIELSVGDAWDGIGDPLPTYFTLHSTKNEYDELGKQANDLVVNMNRHLNHRTFLQGFKIPASLFNTIMV